MNQHIVKSSQVFPHYISSGLDEEVRVQINGINNLYKSKESAVGDFIKVPHVKELENYVVGLLTMDLFLATFDMTKLTPITSGTIDFSDPCKFVNQYFSFPIKYSELPLDSTLIISIYDSFFPGKRKLIGGTSVRLFETMKLQQGKITLKIWLKELGHSHFTPGELKFVEDDKMDPITRSTKAREKILVGVKEPLEWIDKKFSEMEMKQTLEVEKLQQEYLKKPRTSSEDENRMVTLGLTFPKIKSNIPVIFFQPSIKPKPASNYDSGTVSEEIIETYTPPPLKSVFETDFGSGTESLSTSRNSNRIHRDEILIESFEKSLYYEDFVNIENMENNPVEMKHLCLLRDSKEYAEKAIPTLRNKKKLEDILSLTMIQNFSKKSKKLVWMFRYWLKRIRPDSVCKVINSAFEEPEEPGTVIPEDEYSKFFEIKIPEGKNEVLLKWNRKIDDIEISEQKKDELRSVLLKWTREIYDIQISEEKNEEGISVLIKWNGGKVYKKTTLKEELRYIILKWNRKVYDIQISEERNEELKSMLLQWKFEELGPRHALELLSFKYEKVTFIREIAVKKILRELSDNVVLTFLLEFVQALHYEKDPCNSALGEFLVDRAHKDFQIAVFLYSQLNVEIDCSEGFDENFVRFRELVFKNLEKEKQKDLENMMDFYFILKNFLLDQRAGKTKNELKSGLMKENLKKEFREDFGKKHKNMEDVSKLNQLFSETFPYYMDTNVRVIGVKHEECFFFSSATLPLCLVLETTAGDKKIIFKLGDDLRQDQLVTQCVSLMDKMLKNNGLDLKMTPYKILPMELKENQETGWVEFVPSQSFEKISDYKSELLSYFYEKKLRDHHKLTEKRQPFGVEKYVSDNLSRYRQSKEYKKSVELLTKSLAAYCVLSHVLSFGDRHLDNLLLSPTGKMFHIDFGYILGRKPRHKEYFNEVKIDNWMLKDVDEVLWERFLEMICHSYTILRKNGKLIINLLVLMIDSKLKPDPICEIRERNTSLKFRSIGVLLKKLCLNKILDTKSGKYRFRTDYESELEMIEVIKGCFSITNKIWGIVENLSHSYREYKFF